jgi:hypothetical protein
MSTQSGVDKNIACGLLAGATTFVVVKDAYLNFFNFVFNFKPSLFSL